MAGAIIGKTLGKAVNYGLNAYTSYDNYKTNREQGKGVISSTAGVAFDVGLAVLAPHVALAKMGIDLAVTAGQGIYAYGQTGGRLEANKVNRGYGRNFGGNFIDTQNASTMRQRGLQAIQQSGNNINSVFGSEARTFYRGMR